MTEVRKVADLAGLLVAGDAEDALDLPANEDLGVHREILRHVAGNRNVHDARQLIAAEIAGILLRLDLQDRAPIRERVETRDRTPHIEIDHPSLPFWPYCDGPSVVCFHKEAIF